MANLPKSGLKQNPPKVRLYKEIHKENLPDCLILHTPVSSLKETLKLH